MTLNEHINLWQQTFSMIKTRDFLLVSWLAFLFLVVYVTAYSLDDRIPSVAVSQYLQKYQPEAKLFNPLMVAFSNGIIHSKIYA